MRSRGVVGLVVAALALVASLVVFKAQQAHEFTPSHETTTVTP